MKSSEKQRRIEAGRGKLIGELTAWRLRNEPGAEHYLRQAVDPHLRFTTFQALCRVVANKRKENTIWFTSALAEYGTPDTGRTSSPRHMMQPYPTTKQVRP